MSVKSNKNTKSNIVNIGDKLVVSSVKNTHKALMESFKKGSKVDLCSDLIDSIDLTGIQFLLWAEQYAKKMEIELTISIKYSNSAREIIEKTGFSSILK